MHPRFHDLFVHPKSHSPLAFFGLVQGYDEVPVHILSKNHPWPEEILNELEKVQGQKWITGNWENGFLWSLNDPDMYPVIQGIPVFVLPSGQRWPPLSIWEMRQQKWIQRSWTRRSSELLAERSDLERFTKEMAEKKGVILDIASGPAGGFAPGILHANPEASILMNDLGLGVLMEWQSFLKEKEIPNVSFAVFDANQMRIRSGSIDAVSDVWGLNEIGSTDAPRECYRVLRKGGTLYSVNMVVVQDEFGELPADVRAKWLEKNEFLLRGTLGILKDVGFRVVSNSFLKERQMDPEESDLAKEADKHGVRPRVREYCIKAVKD